MQGASGSGGMKVTKRYKSRLNHILGINTYIEVLLKDTHTFTGTLKYVHIL